MKSILRGSIVIIVVLGFLFVGTAKDSARAAQELAESQEVALSLSAGDIGTIDPTAVALIQDLPIAAHIFGSLVRAPIGDCTSLEFQSDLATKWEVSSDKLTWTFHLRRGVKWHWGHGEVTSEDVVYSLNRVKDGKQSVWRANYKNFEEIKAIDKYTVQITTTKPEPFLLTKVANYFGGWIVCKKALEKAGALDRGIAPTKEEVVGTGPFKFVEYSPKDRITMIRNDDYWQGRPIIEKLTFKYIPDDGAQEIALLKGEVAGARGASDAKWLRHMKSQGLNLDTTGPCDMKAIYFNLRAKPFDDKRIREAFAYGTSQESLIKLQGEEISTYCTSPVPTGMYGHIDAGWGKYKRDPEKAKELLAEAGYPDGLTVKLFMSTAPWYLDRMIVFQDELKQCGIYLDMTTLDHTTYKAKMSQGLNPFVIWGMKFPLATYWLRAMYHSDSMIGTPTANQNWMYYSNPEVDKLIELAETTFDEKVRLDALAKAQKIIVEDLPSIPAVETSGVLLRHRWLDLGYEPKNDFLYNYEIGLETKILKH